MSSRSQTIQRLQMQSVVLFLIGGCFLSVGVAGVVLTAAPSPATAPVAPLAHDTTNNTKVVHVIDTITKVDSLIEYKKDSVFIPVPITKVETVTVVTPGPVVNRDSVKPKLDFNELVRRKPFLPPVPSNDHTKDTVKALQKLTDLLKTSNRLYRMYELSKYAPVFADSLFQVNSQVRDLLSKHDGVYAGALTTKEMETLKDYYNRWIDAYNSRKTKYGMVVYKGSTFPTAIGDKISSALDRYNKRLSSGKL